MYTLIEIILRLDILKIKDLLDLKKCLSLVIHVLIFFANTNKTLYCLVKKICGLV